MSSELKSTADLLPYFRCPRGRQRLFVSSFDSRVEVTRVVGGVLAGARLGTLKSTKSMRCGNERRAAWLVPVRKYFNGFFGEMASGYSKSALWGNSLYHKIDLINERYKIHNLSTLLAHDVRGPADCLSQQ
jgi:hypothetical protein